MVKGGRKKKEKKKDFQKVKLKVGKRKLPANNATDTSFKSQAIYIPDQLKTGPTDVSEPLTKRKQSIHDLLTQLGHFNANTRIDALTSLKILLANNRELIDSYVAKLIEKLPKVLVDCESQARKAALAVFKVMFSSLDQEKISPFFSIISTHLQCAMCHLHDAVQQDSLKMFDLCLDYFPKLLCGQNKKVLLDQFLELISVKQSVTASGNVVKGNRILSMKLSGKESSISWRLKVLKRLSKLLRAIHDVSKVTHENKFNEDCPIELRWDSADIMNAIKQKESEIQIHSCESLVTRLSVFSSLSSLSSGTECNELSFYKNISVVIIPLMLDCCVEADHGSTCRLTEERLETLFYALSIIDFLLNRLLASTDDKDEMIGKLRQLYLSDFIKHFFNPFPLIFIPNVQRSKKNSKDEEQRDPKELQAELQSLNLFIADILSLLVGKVESEQRNVLQTLSATASYISNILTIENKRRNITEQNLRSILKTTKVLIRIAADEDTVSNILMPLLVYCDELKACQQQRYILMKFLKDLYEEHAGNNLVLDQWLSSLPYMLYTLFKQTAGNSGGNTGDMQASNSDKMCILEKEDILLNLFNVIFSSMRIGANLRNDVYLSNCQTMFADTISFMRENTVFCLPNVDDDSQLEYCSKCKQLQKSFVETILPFLPTFENEDAKSLVKFLLSSYLHPDVVPYSCEILLLRIKSSSENQPRKTNEACVYGLMCSLMIGGLQCDFANQSSNKCEDSLSTLYEINFKTTSEVDLKRQTLICEQLTDIFRWILSYSPTFTTFLEFFIKERILLHFRVLPLKNVIGVLNIFEILINANSDELTSLIGQFCMDCLLNCQMNSLEHEESCMTIQMKCFEVLKSSQNIFKVFGESMCELDFTNSELLRSVCNIVSGIMSESSMENSSMKTFAPQLLQTMMKSHSGKEQWFFDFKYRVQSL